MNKRRLLKLAALMDEVADRVPKSGPKFDITTWGQTKVNGEGFADLDKHPVLSCGTAACILGEAALSGAFKRQGLRYTVDAGGRIVVRLGAHDGFEAAQELFGLTRDETHAIFAYSELYGPGVMPKGRRGALKAAKTIREFVERGGLPEHY